MTGNGNGDANGCKFIEHHVTKMDTLAGIAIKYGVEVADIKRLNGLATDLQMFALKKLRIPLPGRHPPSHITSNGSSHSRKSSPERIALQNGGFSLLESLESLRLKSTKKNVSPAMNTLQQYYGLKSPLPKSASVGMEMAVYNAGNSRVFEDASLHKASIFRDSTLGYEYLRNGFKQEDCGAVEYGPLIDFSDEGSKQKFEFNFGNGTPEKLLKGENSGGSTGYSTITGKNLDLRRKSASRTSLLADAESSWANSSPYWSGDSSNSDDFVVVRKSFSSSSLQDHEGNAVSSNAWPVLSAASIAKPILDGLTIPMSSRKSKAALD